MKFGCHYCYLMGKKLMFEVEELHACQCKKIFCGAHFVTHKFDYPNHVEVMLV
jgi:hypothetical protein